MLQIRIDEPGVHKMCISTEQSPWLDTHFSFLAGVVLVVSLQPTRILLFVTFKAAGSVESFEVTLFSERLAAFLGVEASNVETHVEAASLLISVIIRTTSVAEVAFVSRTLLSSSVASLSQVLRVDFWDVPTVQSSVLLMPSPPQLPPTPQLPEDQSASSPPPADMPRFTLSPRSVLSGVRLQIRFVGESPPDGSTVVFLATGTADCVRASRIRASQGGIVHNASVSILLEQRHIYKLCLSPSDSLSLDSDFTYVPGVHLVVESPSSPPVLTSTSQLTEASHLSVEDIPSRVDHSMVLFVVPPCAAILALLTVHALQTDPHLAGIPDLLAALPLFLFAWVPQKHKRHLTVLVKVSVAALYGSLHFCLVLLFVIDLWQEETQENELSSMLYCNADSLKHTALALFAGPSLVTLVVCIVIVARSLLRPNPMLHPEVVREQARAVSVALMLATLDEGMLALLPWTSTSWAGFPARWLLVCIMMAMLVRQVPLIVLTAFHISCGIGEEAERNREVAMLVLLVLTLIQEVVEKGLLAAVGQRGNPCLHNTHNRYIKHRSG
jgi:hypothetical protein